MSLLRKHLSRLTGETLKESTEANVDLIDTQVGNEPADEITEDLGEKKSFAMALSVACMGGQWKKDDGIAHVHKFVGTFPSEGVEVELLMDVHNKEYTLIVTKNGSEIIHDRKDYRVAAGVAAAVAFRLSQEAFGTPNTPIAEGDEADPRIEFQQHIYKNTGDLFVSCANFDARGNDLDTIFALAETNSSYIEGQADQFSHEGHNFSVVYNVDDEGDHVLTVSLLPSVAGTGETLVSESVAVGDEVTVDGEDAVVKNPDAPGDTASVLVKGEEKVVDKRAVQESADLDTMVRDEKVQLDEMVLGMTNMPDISRMQALAGVRSGAEVAKTDIPLAQVAANVMALSTGEADACETEVIDLTKEEDACEVKTDVAGCVDSALATLEQHIGSLTISEFKAAKARLDAMSGMLFSESVATRAKKV